MYSPDHFSRILVDAFAITQILYALCFWTEAYFLTLPVNRVDMAKAQNLLPSQYPFVVLFYPVLRELEETMRTTFTALGRLHYPSDRFRVISVPNASDVETIASLRRLQDDFPFVDMLIVPPTSDASWDAVWKAWDDCPKAYWWHRGRRKKNRNLPAKKTRQLIYAFYNTARIFGPDRDFLINYIDADSAPPVDHFLAAAAGIQDFDVLQAENIAGNLNQTLAASWHAFDHMVWDGMTYQHMSADGRHPYWVLGKGLFFRASDLIALGGFHPWITIEDPEVGMRFWLNGKRLGVIKNPLIEEVPVTFARGITQRKRWVAGFFQSLGIPLVSMGMTFGQRMRARLNFLPCLSLLINPIGIPVGVWALIAYLRCEHLVPMWLFPLAVFNVLCYIILMSTFYWRTWERTRIVRKRWIDRAWYMLRVNPVFLFIWWIIWVIPLAIGFGMFMFDRGLIWDRTEKIDANSVLVRRHDK